MPAEYKQAKKKTMTYGIVISQLVGALSPAPQWGAADAEIKVPSGENIELKRSPS